MEVRIEEQKKVSSRLSTIDFKALSFAVRLLPFCFDSITRLAEAPLLNEQSEIDTDKIDDTVLALLWLTMCDENRAWKGHDWDAMGRLHEKKMIYDPVGKAKSVSLTPEGLERSKRLFYEMFSKKSS